MKLTIESTTDSYEKINAQIVDNLIILHIFNISEDAAIDLTSFEARTLARALLDMVEKLEAPVISYKEQAVEAPVVRHEAPEQLTSEDVCLNCGKMLANHITGYQGVYCSDDCMKQSGDSEVVEIVDRSDLTIKALHERIVDIRNAGSILAEKVLETESGIMVYVSPDVWQKEHKILVSEFATKRNSLLSIKRDSENHYWWLIDTLPF